MRKKRFLIAILSITGACLASALVLLCLGYPNRAVVTGYPVKGIDVSSHQGNIDWEKVAKSGSVRFAYIKATEGADFKDKSFDANWKAAAQAGLVRGAYHYFKITSSGKDQAANFIAAVPVEKGCLPPAVDIEEGGLPKDQFCRELGDFISAVEARYCCKPVLYVYGPLYREYIRGYFTDCPTWTRNVILPPAGLPGQWLFWQYGGWGRVDGISTGVDTDVFNGSEIELDALLSK